MKGQMSNTKQTDCIYFELNRGNATGKSDTCLTRTINVAKKVTQ
jgi:hypothetical protein